MKVVQDHLCQLNLPWLLDNFQSIDLHSGIIVQFVIVPCQPHKGNISNKYIIHFKRMRSIYGVCPCHFPSFLFPVWRRIVFAKAAGFSRSITYKRWVNNSLYRALPHFNNWWYAITLSKWCTVLVSKEQHFVWNVRKKRMTSYYKIPRKVRFDVKHSTIHKIIYKFDKWTIYIYVLYIKNNKQPW